MVVGLQFVAFSCCGVGTDEKSLFVFFNGAGDLGITFCNDAPCLDDSIKTAATFLGCSS